MLPVILAATPVGKLVQERLLHAGERHAGHRGASIVSATRSSGSRLWTCDLPQARASVCVSSVSTRR